MNLPFNLPSNEIENSAKKLSGLLVNTYLLYLKTQNYHWNTIDPNFYTFHQLFEKQYKELASAVDEIAEHIRILGRPAPATFAKFLKVATLTESLGSLNGYEMIKELFKDHQSITIILRLNIKEMATSNDERTKDFLTSRLIAHEK